MTTAKIVLLIVNQQADAEIGYCDITLLLCYDSNKCSIQTVTMVIIHIYCKCIPQTIAIVTSLSIVNGSHK